MYFHAHNWILFKGLTFFDKYFSYHLSFWTIFLRYLKIFGFGWGYLQLSLIECQSIFIRQFVYSLGGSCTRWSFMQLIWLCCVWVMWNERNSRVFENTENTIHHLIEKVKLHSFCWMKTLIFLFGLILVCGGQALLFVSALANYFFLFFFDLVTVYF